MAVSETFFRRLIVEMKRSSDRGVTRLLDDSDTGVKWVVPVDAHLAKGAKGVLVPIADTVEGSPERALMVLKTTRPGVVARLCQVGTQTGCKASGTLLTVADNVYDDWDGVTVQDVRWAVGQWSSILQDPVTSASDSQWGHEVVVATAGAGQSSINAPACWGSSYLNLGEQNDGKILQFWVKIPFTSGGESLSKGIIRLSSYPYGAAVHDDDIVGGGVDDANIPSTGRPYFDFEFYNTSGPRQLIEDDAWSMVTARKEAFSSLSGAASEGAPIWNRITGLRVRAEYGGVVAGETMRVGSVYFGDRLEQPFDSVTVQSYLPTASVPLVLSLDGPSDGPAWVRGLVVAK